MECGFVVLHYRAYDMTVRCVDTIIKKFNNEKYHIVVIDNGSGDNTGIRLSEKYNNDIHIDVLLNENNLGFANGNNIGYKYMKTKYNPDFIVVMNNDVLINDGCFISRIKSIYEKTKFDVLGPDIYNPIMNNHQNPICLKTRNLAEVEKRYYAFFRRYRFSKIYYILSCIKSLIERKKKSTQNDYYLKQHVNPVLHGACLIFSSRFIQLRDDCFNPKTFLYHEEDILNIECKRLNLTMLYSPDVFVEHLEDVSTNLAFSSEYKKYKLQNKWLRDSSKVLIEILENEINEE